MSNKPAHVTTIITDGGTNQMGEQGGRNIGAKIYPPPKNAEGKPYPPPKNAEGKPYPPLRRTESE